jgi:hypothetical protein
MQQPLRSELIYVMPLAASRVTSSLTLTFGAVSQAWQLDSAHHTCDDTTVGIQYVEISTVRRERPTSAEATVHHSAISSSLYGE